MIVIHLRVPQNISSGFTTIDQPEAGGCLAKARVPRRLGFHTASPAILISGGRFWASVAWIYLSP
jgi:hypothetical protein